MAQDVVTVDFLPDEILLKIFSNLSVSDLELSASNVCHRWKRLISRLILRLQLPADHFKMHGDLMALFVIKYNPSLPNPTILALLISSMVNLKELTICIEYSFEEEHLEIIRTLKNLRHLDVFTKMDLGESMLLPPNITSLVVNSNMAPGFLTSVNRISRGFKAFHMYGKAAQFPSIQMNKFLQKNSRYLTELTLRCSILGNKNYETIAQCEKLTSLQLYECWQLTSTSITVLTKLTHLRRLHITGTALVRSDGLLDFVRNLPQQIEDLNLSYSCFGYEHYGALAGRLPGLRRLELWRTREMHGAHLVCLLNALAALEVVDTDTVLSGVNIRALSGHQSLRNIRCKMGHGIREMRHKFYIRSATASRTTMVCSDEEGPSAELFYYWLQPPLSSPPGATPPCYHYIN